MTSPSVDLDGIMPYGVTVSGDGTNRTARFVTSAKQAKENRLELPGGPVRVSASWSGAEAVRLTLAGVGYPVNIPAGGGFRSGTAVVGSKSRDTIYLESANDVPLSATGRGTIEVYPLPQL